MNKQKLKTSQQQDPSKVVWLTHQEIALLGKLVLQLGAKHCNLPIVTTVPLGGGGEIRRGKVQFVVTDLWRDY